MNKLLSSRRTQTVIGFLVSIVLIVWVVQEIDWAIAWKESKAMHFWPLIPLTIIQVLHYMLRAYRWRFLLAGGEKTSFSLLFDAILIGTLATFILPLRAGEFIRPFVLAREAQPAISFPAAFTSVVIERFFDLAIVLATFALVLLFIPEVPDWVHNGAYALSCLGFGIFLFILMGILMPHFLLNSMQFILKPFPEGIKKFFLGISREFIAGAHVLKSPRNLSLTILTSLLVWGTNYLFFYAGFYLLDIPGTLLIATTTAVIVALAVAAPSAPGFVGVIQVSCIAAFALFGLSKDLAAAYSILIHIFQYLFVCSLGCYGLLKRNLSLVQLQIIVLV